MFDKLMEMLQDYYERGLVDADGIQTGKKVYGEGADHIAAAVAARRDTLGRRAVVADRAAEGHEQWITKTMDFIEKWEGNDPYAYDDANGIRTVGIGFNLERKGARKVVEDEGLDYDRIKAGKDPVSSSIARKWAMADLRHSANSVRDILEPEHWAKLTDDQRTSLTSMYFNGGTKLIKKGFNITKAIQEGRMKDAYDEIRWRSNNDKIPGLENRRIEEAIWFRHDATPPQPPRMKPDGGRVPKP